MCVATIVNWETDQAMPEIQYMSNVITFIGYNPLPPPTEKTFGVLLHARRRELGLTHKAAAKVLDVSPDTILYWENEGQCPQPQFMPRIIAFLGCDPFLKADPTIADLLKAKRRTLGITQAEAAHQLTTTNTAYSRWELGGLVWKKKDHKAIAELLGLSMEEVRGVREKRTAE